MNAQSGATAHPRTDRVGRSPQVVLASAHGVIGLSDLTVLQNHLAMFALAAAESTVGRTFDRVGRPNWQASNPPAVRLAPERIIPYWS